MWVISIFSTLLNVYCFSSCLNQVEISKYHRDVTLVGKSPIHGFMAAPGQVWPPEAQQKQQQAADLGQ